MRGQVQALMDEKTLKIILIVDIVIITVCLLGIFVCDMIDAYENKKYGKLEEELFKYIEEKNEEKEKDERGE